MGEYAQILDLIGNYGFMMVFATIALVVYIRENRRKAKAEEKRDEQNAQLQQKLIDSTFNKINETEKEQSNLKEKITKIDDTQMIMMKNQDKQNEILNTLSVDLKITTKLTEEIANMNRETIERNTQALNANKDAVNNLASKMENDIYETQNLKKTVLEHDKTSISIRHELTNFYEVINDKVIELDDFINKLNDVMNKDIRNKYKIVYSDYNELVEFTDAFGKRWKTNKAIEKRYKFLSELQELDKNLTDKLINTLMENDTVFYK